jgi:hypothetical protein
MASNINWADGVRSDRFKKQIPLRHLQRGISGLVVIMICRCLRADFKRRIFEDEIKGLGIIVGLGTRKDIPLIMIS